MYPASSMSREKAKLSKTKLTLMNGDCFLSDRWKLKKLWE